METKTDSRKASARIITVLWDKSGFPIVENPADTMHTLRPIRKLTAGGDTNTKLRKSLGYGFRTIGLSLSPSKESGFGNLCGSSSTGCVDACLDHQGLASVFENIRFGRIARTALWFLHRDWFLSQLSHEIFNAQRLAERNGEKLAVRLNVFYDIQFEKYGVLSQFPNVEFYDYSKHVGRAGQMLPNYWVTFSRSETNHEDCLRELQRGNNVAIAFDTGRVGNRVSMDASPLDLPKTWHGFPVIDGDTTDLRFDDLRGRSRGRVVGLRLKAASRAERLGALESGFAIPRKASK